MSRSGKGDPEITTHNLAMGGRAVRLTQLRFTLRWSMVAVALLALGMGAIVWGLKMRRQASYYASQAEVHKRAESVFRTLHADALQNVQALEALHRARGDKYSALPRERRESQPDRLTELRVFEAQLDRKATHHDALNRKYKRAASYPWLTVEPDPPEPE
jgi:hypothetical protein